MSPTLWLTTGALLRALSGAVDGADETANEEAAATHAEAAAPQAARATPCREQTPAGSSAHLTAENEPGQRLVVAGRVVGPDGRTPAAGVTVYAYQADATGRYSAKSGPDDNQNPRLCAILRTDAAGNFRLDSVRPGAYAGAGSAHIHFEIWSERQARRQFLLTFKERPAAKDAESAAAAGDRHAPRRPVVRDVRGVWHCVRDFRLS